MSSQASISKFLPPLAETFKRQGKPELVILHFQDAVRIVPSDAGVHEELAARYGKIGHIGEARTHYRQAIEWMDAGNTENIQQVVVEIERLH